MARPAKFWDRMAARYARQPVADEASYQRKLEMTRGYLDADMALLEIGCGTGSTAIVHAPHVRHILATDISEKMLEIAKEKAEAEGIENISFQCAAVEELDVDRGSMDAVLALSILHLLPDWREALVKLNQLLKPGGLLVSSTACIGDMSFIMRMLPPVMKVVPMLPAVQAFTVAELKQGLDQAGFELEKSWQPEGDQAVFIVARKKAEPQ
ncbi:MAG: class I SAM-dependent methyltransferase [Halioglobus sp.]